MVETYVVILKCVNIQKNIDVQFKLEKKLVICFNVYINIQQITITNINIE